MKERRILVIDDELDFLESIRRGLIIAGFRNITVLNKPIQIKELLRENCFDIALIDVSMPQMNGLEVLQYIKSVCPDTICMMVTAIDDAETARQCLRLGAREYLIKPVSREKLLQVLTRADG